MRSRCTSGSAFSFTKMPAVVCSAAMTQMPSLIFDRVTAARTRAVMSVVETFVVVRISRRS